MKLLLAFCAGLMTAWLTMFWLAWHMDIRKNA
jgi:hypothetical protein